MDRLLKREKRRLPRSREAEPTLLRAVLWGILLFAAVLLLLSLALTAVACGQKDPDAYRPLGKVLPFLAAILAGAAGGRAYPDRPWVSGGILGVAAALLMWLSSAGITARVSEGQTVLWDLAVAATVTLSAAFLGPRRQPRRPRHHLR